MRKGFWGYLAASIAFFAILFVASSVKLWEPDTFMHARIGQWIVENGRIPHRDIFSHLAAGQAWVAHEWLFGVVVHVVQSSAGWVGVGLLRSLILTASIFPVLAVARLLGAGKWASLALAAVAACLASLNLEFRPHAVTFLLFSTTLWVSHAHFAGKRARLWLLPPICLLWANMHGAFVLFFAAAAAFLLGEFLEIRFRNRGNPKRCRVYLLIVVACVLASMINPAGPGIWVFPFTALDKNFGARIQEWNPPSPQYFYPFFLILAGSFAVMWADRKSVRFSHLLLFAGFGILALHARRNVAPFALAAIPIMGASMVRVLQDRPRFLRPPLLILLLVGLLQLQRFESMGNQRLLKHWGFGIDRREVPEAAADFMLKTRPAGELFNDYEFGGYLIYRLLPEYRVFFDGRMDLYGSDDFRTYSLITEGNPRYRELLMRYKVNVAMLVYLPPDVPGLATQLDNDPEWSLVFWDDKAMVYARRIPQNQQLISTFGFRYVKPAQPPAAWLTSRDVAQRALEEVRRNLTVNPESGRARWLEQQCMKLLN